MKKQLSKKATVVRHKINWAEMISDWQRSGLSQEAFCKDRGIKYSTFVYWRVKKLKSAEQAQQPSRAFVAVQLGSSEQASAANGAMIEVSWPTGMRLSLPATLDQESLKNIFMLLGMSAC